MSFISIRLSTVRPGFIVPFDVYLKVADCFVHYLHKGDDFDQSRLQSLRIKGLKKFHINEKDESNYQVFLSNFLENIHLSSNEVKTSVALDVTENATQEMIKNPTTEKSYNLVKSSSDIVKKVLTDNDVILREIVSHSFTQNSSLSERMQSHLINTASIAIKFAETLKSNIPTNSLGVAAFYHDVSFTQFSESDQHLFFKDISEMDPASLSIYKTHPEKSVQILQDKSFAEKEVLDLIMAHEEKLSGQGFPNKRTKLSPAQEILSLCAFYDREITCLGKDSQTISNNLMIEQVGNYNLELLKNFKSFLKSYL